jgi:hypothetical protein
LNSTLTVQFFPAVGTRPDVAVPFLVTVTVLAALTTAQRVRTVIFDRAPQSARAYPLTPAGMLPSSR